MGNQIKQGTVLDTDNPTSATSKRITESSSHFELIDVTAYQVSSNTRYNDECDLS